MVREWCSIGRVLALATAALLFSSGAGQAGHGGGGGGGGHGGGGGGHGGGGMHGGGSWHGGGGYYHGGYYHHGYYPGFYGFGLGFGLGYGLGYGWGYPWYYGDYYTGGYSPAYYDNGYDYPPQAYSPGASPYAGGSTTAANPYSYPSAAAGPGSAPVPNENAIYVRVQVPPDAEVWFEGQKTSQTGPVRFFESPPVDPGREYVYHIRARWNQNGHPVDQLRDVHVYAGDKFSVDFTKMEKLPLPKPKG